MHLSTPSFTSAGKFIQSLAGRSVLPDPERHRVSETLCGTRSPLRSALSNFNLYAFRIAATSRLREFFMLCIPVPSLCQLGFKPQVLLMCGGQCQLSGSQPLGNRPGRLFCEPRFAQLKMLHCIDEVFRTYLQKALVCLELSTSSACLFFHHLRVGGGLRELHTFREFDPRQARARIPDPKKPMGLPGCTPQLILPLDMASM